MIPSTPTVATAIANHKLFPNVKTTMARAPSKFRQGDVTRMVAGVVAAGVEVREVVVDTDGRIRVIAGKPNVTSVQQVEEANEWDRIQ
jgi:hypothetical protein